MRALALAILVGGLLVGGSARAFGDGSLARVRGAGKLVIAIDPTYPPMEFEKDGQPFGFDIDFAREVARRLGVEAELLVMDWTGIIAGLNSRRYDVIISSMNITEERSREVAFVPYMSSFQVFVCGQGGRGGAVKSEQDLADRVVTVQSNTTSHSFVQALQKKGLPIRKILDTPNATDTFNALNAGQAEVIVTDESVGRYYARLNPAFVVTGRALEAQPIGIAVRKEDQDLQQALGKAVESLTADGTLHRISEEWFGGLDQFSPPAKSFWRFSWDVVIPRILSGMGLTLLVTALSGFFGILLGLVLSLARIARGPVLSTLALAYVTLFRGTPLLLQIFFIFYALPPLLGIRLGALTSGVMALSLNAAAYITEIFRAAIQSIDRGQSEAARALGMSYGLTMRRVILPQTFRRLIPPLVNELAALAKDSSLVSVLALHEMLYQTNRTAATYLRPWEVYLWAALGYLAIVLTLTTLAGRLEKRLEAREA